MDGLKPWRRLRHPLTLPSFALIASSAVVNTVGTVLKKPLIEISGSGKQPYTSTLSLGLNVGSLADYPLFIHKSTTP